MSEQHEWVRQQLAGLPPVPMPPEVRDRLDSAIRAEARDQGGAGLAAAPAQHRAAGQEGPAATGSGSTGGHSDGAAAGSTTAAGPRRWWLGLAAAAAVLAALALVNPAGLVPDGSGGDVAAERAAEPEAGTASSPLLADSEDAGAERPSRLQIQQASLASPMSYSEASLGERLRALLPGSDGSADPAEAAAPTGDPGGLPDSWRSAVAVAAATPEGLADCVWALPWDGELLVVVERAAYNADPAIIVVRQEGEQWEVLVQHSACSAGNPYVLHRATVER